MDSLEEGLDDTSLEARLSRPPPAPAPPAPKPEKVDPAVKEIAGLGDQNLIEWFKGFSGANVKISLHRLSPESWEGRQVAGHLATFDELIDEDQIAERYGGGKYQVKAQKMMGNGRWQFAGAKSFKIAGDPKITAEHFKDKDKDRSEVIPLAPVPNHDSDVTKATLQTMERLAVKQMERAEKIEDAARAGQQQSPFNETLIAMLTKPLETQIQSLNAQIAAKDQLLVEKDRIIKDLSERRPDTSVQDKLLDKMYDGESSKLTALRTQFDSERRILMENHAEALKRAEHRSDTERQNLIEAHKRELKSLESGYEHQLKASELSHKGLLDAKENRIKDLERTITKLDLEIADLKAKKEKTLIEQAQELAQVQETLKAMGMGGGEGDEEQSTAERIIGLVAENPIIRGIGQRIASPEPARSAPQYRQQPPRPAPPRPLPAPRRARPAPMQTPAQARPAQAPQVTLPEGVSPQAVQQAVDLMEGAITNGTEPDVFAQSIRNMVPTAVVNFIQTHGIDSLLEGVAQLSEASPLSTQVGRTFARRVAKALAVEAA